jgi:hypothetical protein
VSPSNPDASWLHAPLPVADPPPPLPRTGRRALRVAGRVALWTLIAVGAVRGVVPAAPAPSAVARPAGDHAQAAAVAAAFLREYLTVGDGQAGRRARLAPFLAAGVDLADAVRVGPAGAQYVDEVVPAGVRPAGGTVEVTVLAHVLEVRAGRYRGGATLAFVVPVVAAGGGLGVSGIPRPAPLPASPVPLPGRIAPPPELSGPVRVAAERAVARLLVGDREGLARLGDRDPPQARALPPGWRGHGVAGTEVSGPGGALVAEVLVRASPPGGGASYLLPVRVWLVAGSVGPVVRRVDGGGPVW